MSILVNQVSKLYGQQKALNQVSFEAKPGEILGFLGPNGAGKSTMMKIITGFLPPSEGQVLVSGIDVSEKPLQVKKKIGYLAEQNPLYYDMYVREFLHFIAGVFKLEKPEARIDELIQMVGLELEQNKKIGALSKGYKQRVGLAQALLQDPDVLILDEPTTGLDPNQLEEIRKLIKKIGQEKTVMLSTHIMQEVEAICDRVIIINKGEIVANDSTENLSKLFAKKAGLLVEFDKEISKEKIKAISTVLSAESNDLKKWRIIHQPDPEINNSLFKLAQKEEISILTIQKENISLENIFKELTSSS